MGRFGRVIVGVATALAVACHGEPYSGKQRSALPVKALYKSLQCGRSDSSPSVEVISNAEQMEQIYRKLGQVLGGQPIELPAISYGKEVAMLVEMGQRPTAGYGLVLDGSTATLRGGIAEVHVIWLEPSEGAVVAQLITSPCLLIALPRDSYESVRIVDQDEQVRLRAAIR